MGDLFFPRVLKQEGSLFLMFLIEVDVLTSRTFFPFSILMGIMKKKFSSRIE